MMLQRYLKKSDDDAISPVIGIMLMLVVTIIIAAVVAAFSTGLISDTEVPPNAVLDVSLDACYDGGFSSYPMFSIGYVSGDADLDTAKMSIDFSWKCPYCGWSTTYHYAPDLDNHQTCSGAYAALIYPQTEPLWSSEPSLWAGNHIFKPGQTMITPTIYCWCAYDSSTLLYDNCCMQWLLGGEINECIVYGCLNEDCYLPSSIVGQELGVIIRYNEHIIYDDVVVIE